MFPRFLHCIETYVYVRTYTYVYCVSYTCVWGGLLRYAARRKRKAHWKKTGESVEGLKEVYEGMLAEII